MHFGVERAPDSPSVGTDAEQCDSDDGERQEREQTGRRAIAEQPRHEDQRRDDGRCDRQGASGPAPGVQRIIEPA